MKRTPETGSTLPVVLLVIAAGFLGSILTLWLARSFFYAPTASSENGVEYSQLRKEVALLRKELAELRASRQPLRVATLPPRRQETSQDLARTETKEGREDPWQEDGRKPEGETKKEGDERGWGAVQKMRNLEDPAERLALAETLLEEGDFWGRHGAILELLKQDPATAAAHVHDLLAAAADQPKGGWAANSAVQALGRVGGYAVDADLRRIYDEVDIRGVGLTAARALESRGDSSRMRMEVDRFREMIHGNDPQARVWGVELLGATRSVVAVPYLLPLLENSDVEIRLRAVDALGSAGSASEIAAIEAMLNDPVAAVRDRAVEALRNLRRS
jgi:hypothetical protein